VWELSQEIEQLCGSGRIRMLDIGGGLSVNYSTDEAPQVCLTCKSLTCIPMRTMALVPHEPCLAVQVRSTRLTN
jgi:hypothetical protein